MEFNHTTLLAGMEGNDTLRWMYKQGIKPKIQKELLARQFTNLQDLQAAAINMDDLLYAHKKQQNLERRTQKELNTKSNKRNNDHNKQANTKANNRHHATQMPWN